MFGIPDPSFLRGYRRPVGYIAAALAALAAYLAVSASCSQARGAIGGEGYTPLALSVIAYAIAALLVASSERFSPRVRVLTGVTLPIAVLLVPAVAIGVLQEVASRACATPL
jgi:hypothetical protein